MKENNNNSNNESLSKTLDLQWQSETMQMEL